MPAAIKLSEVVADNSRYDFAARIEQHDLDLTPLTVDILQVNLTKLCNQACRHCHVDSSPARTEALSRDGVEQLVEILRAHPQISALDVTGGAPELHPDFDWLVQQCSALGCTVMVRHDLTVTFDGNPQTGKDMHYLPAFFAEHRCEVVSSLPYYQEFFTDKQRGSGVFQKSIEGIRQLNALGYGQADSDLKLNLVYNPVGPYLPAPQPQLEADYKRELKQRFGLVFNNLFTITNMPINRFSLHLKKSGQYEEYMDKLLAAFNPGAAEGVMCRNLISVDHEGRIYDCDFNQMLDMPVDGAVGSIFEFDYDKLLQRRIKFAAHCFGCTAGAGSSCGGATA